MYVLGRRRRAKNWVADFGHGRGRRSPLHATSSYLVSRHVRAKASLSIHVSLLKKTSASSVQPRLLTRDSLLLGAKA